MVVMAAGFCFEQETLGFWPVSAKPKLRSFVIVRFSHGWLVGCYNECVRRHAPALWRLQMLDDWNGWYMIESFEVSCCCFFLLLVFFCVCWTGCFGFVLWWICVMFFLFVVFWWLIDFAWYEWLLSDVVFLMFLIVIVVCDDLWSLSYFDCIVCFVWCLWKIVCCFFVLFCVMFLWAVVKVCDCLCVHSCLWFCCVCFASWLFVVCGCLCLSLWWCVCVCDVWFLLDVCCFELFVWFDLLLWWLALMLMIDIFMSLFVHSIFCDFVVCSC